jgi:hypothetical protein
MLGKSQQKLDQQQGCQIFIGTTYQNGEQYTKSPQNVSNGHKIYLLAVNYIPNGHKISQHPP